MKIKFKACATIANLVCGFDILGLALNAPYDEMEMELINEPIINIKHLDNFNLPTKAEENVAGVALQALLNAYENKNIGFNITINKLIKPGSGLGSSAASAAGAVLGANQLLSNPFTKNELVGFAMYGEALASGAMHADNIAPCIYGGITLIRSTSPLDIVQLTAPPMYVTIVHPQIEIKTSEARAILPKEISLKNAVTQWANVAGLVTGFLQNDYELISRSLEDVIVEPYRSKLIPGFDEVKLQYKLAGALGGGISGSGPAIFMLSKDEITAKNVEQVMKDIYTKIGIDFNTYVTTIKSDEIFFSK
jgi:homoserine kinase